jgi:hypothetical protein
VLTVICQVEREFKAWEKGTYIVPPKFDHKLLDTKTKAFFKEWVAPLLDKPGRVAQILDRIADTIEVNHANARAEVRDHRAHRSGMPQALPSSDVEC